MIQPHGEKSLFGNWSTREPGVVAIVVKNHSPLAVGCFLSRIVGKRALTANSMHYDTNEQDCQNPGRLRG
jgi:hypothetical protein